MMDIKKTILYIIVASLGIVLLNAWMRDYQSNLVENPKLISIKENGKISTNYTPPTFTPSTTETTKTETEVSILNNQEKDFKNRLITVKTDVLELAIDTYGGNIVSAQLPKYPFSLEDKKTHVRILSNDRESLYIAQSGLTNLYGKLPIHYTVQKKQYELTDHQNVLIIQLRAQTHNGLRIRKIYTFHRNNYAIQISYQVHNTTNKIWEGSLYTQIIRRKPIDEHQHFYLRSYNGAAISSPKIPYEKVTYEAMDKQNISRNSKHGWIAMQQHYFLSAWIPENPNLMYHYYSRVIFSGTAPNVYIIGFVSPKMSVASGETATSYATLYIGPEVAKLLKSLAPGLDHTIDYGWLLPISNLLFWIMSITYALLKNWGWTIVLTTILIKIVFYWFSAKSFRSMARIREIQPHLQALKERYGDNRQELSRATIEFYRKEKINPFGGCLPMLIQIPVFIAFYYVIIESVELRQAPFIFWIHDLSLKDPYYILPILMGLSMLVQQSLSPASPDLTQQKVMWILPVIFTVFFINFPAGLVLYWLTNNVVQTLQQLYVNKNNKSYKTKLKI